MKKLTLISIFCLLSLSVFAQTPIGKWITVDEKTKEQKSVIQIYEDGGKIYGKIFKLLKPKADDPDPVCTKCDGANKGKKMLGLVIINKLKKDGNEWNGGTILDPSTGKVYRCKLSMDGKNLVVRGYLGFSMFGRSQTWLPYSE